MAAMRAPARAAECTEQLQIETLHLRQAAGLMHLFVRRMEARDRRRAEAELIDGARRSTMAEPAEQTRAADRVPVF